MTQYINHANLPPKLPALGTLVIYMALDYFHAPQWLWGAAVVVLAIVWIVMIVALANAKYVDLLPGDKLK